MNKVSYKYGEAKINVQGRGFRGFGWTEITGHTAEIVNKIIYERDYKCTSSKIRRTEQRTLSGTLLAETDNEIAMQDHGHGVTFSYVKKSTTKQYKLNSSLIKTMVTTTQMDSYIQCRGIKSQY